MGVVVDTIKSPDGKEIVFRFSEVYQGWFNLPHIKAMIEEVFAAGKIIYYAPIGQDPTLWVPDSIKPGPFVQSLIIKDAMEEN